MRESILCGVFPDSTFHGLEQHIIGHQFKYKATILFKNAIRKFFLRDLIYTNPKERNDLTCLKEVPKESILIISHSTNKGHCQPPRSSNFCQSCPPVLMLPQNSMVLFMHAHTVFNCFNTTSEICEMGIKIFDVTQTITSL